MMKYTFLNLLAASVMASTTKTDRRPDCVTEIRMGNSVLTVSGFFKQGATDTAADKMKMCIRDRFGTGGGICPLIDKDGKPIISE